LLVEPVEQLKRIGLPPELKPKAASIQL